MAQLPFDAPKPAAPAAVATNLPEFRVGELGRAIRSTLEGEFGRVRVRGEVSNFKRHGSGHLYFRLKDEEAVIEACCWRQSAARLSVRPEDGLEVVCTGRVSAYVGRSQYQLIVESIELAGEGALLKLLEERRRALAAEGLFAEERKRPLPFLPEVIGIVTSPTGAVIRDIMHRLRDRFPRHVLLWPVAVQGETAAAQVAAAIRGFGAIPACGPVPRPDVLIVARGGGSLEDLWAFNEEVVVRAAAESPIPLISAIGHETDTTLIDFAADRRAPTPTAAAEMAVPVRADLLAQLLDRERRLVSCGRRAIEDRQARLEGLARGLPDAASLLQTAVQRLDDRSERLQNAGAMLLERRAARLSELAGRLRHPRDQIEAKAGELRGQARALDQAATGLLARTRHGFERLSAEQRLVRGMERRIADARVGIGNLGALLESYSYRGVLRRGFALVRHDDRAITSRDTVSAGMRLTLTFGDGDAAVTADGGGTPPDTAETRGREAKPRRRRDEPDQGSLL
ncbi:MAG: exodeoxyribonuclease VII large subunit [Alphaproteobacteria bacterium]